MLQNLNPKKMQEMMKKLGMSQENIPTKRVIIERASEDGNIIIENPSVVKMKIQGQESFQISGETHEEETGISEEDIKTVMEKTNSSEKEAKKTLENTDGNLADAILELSK